MSRLSLLLGVFAVASIFNVHAFVQTDNSPYAIVENGVAIPVKNSSGLSKKYQGQTLYLSCAVRSTRCTSKPAPSPKPIPSPKPTPVVLKSFPSTPAPEKVAVTVSKPSKKSDSGSSKASLPVDDPEDDYGTSKAAIADPIQPVNRGVFWFNHQLYHYVFTPLNKTYKFIIPETARSGIHNVFLNFEYPTRCVNDLLQWQLGRAGQETEKFIVNTTAGVGGLFRASDKIPSLANVPQTDTSATLAKWKIPPGCYIIWPVLGPKSARDTVGFVGDIALDPVTWLTYGAVGGVAGATTLAVSAPETTTKTSDKLDNYETVTRTSIDKYSAVKSAYEQNRKKVEIQ